MHLATGFYLVYFITLLQRAFKERMKSSVFVCLQGSPKGSSLIRLSKHFSRETFRNSLSSQTSFSSSKFGLFTRLHITLHEIILSFIPIFLKPIGSKAHSARINCRSAGGRGRCCWNIPGRYIAKRSSRCAQTCNGEHCGLVSFGHAGHFFKKTQNLSYLQSIGLCKYQNCLF